MADALAVRDEYRAQTWALLIQECNNSGLTKWALIERLGLRKGDGQMGIHFLWR